MPNMDYSLIQRTPDGTGKILVTTPGSPDKGSYVLEADMKIYTNQGMVAIADIVDDLVTADAAKPLSANQGVVLKQLIDAFSGGIVPKGDILSTNLPPADDTNKGWQYYCTDTNQWATSDGTQWIMTSNNVITQTPDATDTGHALSNAVVTQKCNAVEATLNQHDARLQNLEQKAGDYSIVQYRGTDAVPTGKAKYGLVKNIVGKTRAWNQLVQNGNFTDDVTGWYATRGTIAYDSGRCKYTITSMGGSDNLSHRIYRNIKFIANHTYLIAFDIQSPRAGNACCDAYSAGIGFDFTFPFSANVRTQLQRIVTATTTATAPFDVGFGGYDSQYGYQVGDIIYFDNVILRDLTLIFPEGVPSTIAECVDKCPDLLKYDAYNAGSLVSTTVEGVEAVGVNIWDEEWHSGSFNDTTGVFNYNAGTDVCAYEYIPVIPSTEYYFNTNSKNMYVAKYDADKNYLGYSAVSNSFLAIPSNCYYLKFQMSGSYGTTYNQDIQICLNSYADKTSYHPYMTDTLLLSETVTLRSAGSVADELDVESGVIARNVGSYTFDGTEEWNSSGSNCNVTSVIGTIVKKPGSNSIMSNVLCDGFIARTPKNIYDGVVTDGIAVDTQGRIRVPNAQVSSMIGKTINFELDTPTAETIDPVPDNFIEVEGGGTVETIQTQTPIIDNCLDVGYLTV